MTDLQFFPSVWVLFISAAVAVVLGVAVWRQRPGMGVIPFVLLMVAVTCWSIGNAFEQIFVDYTYKFIFTRLNYIWITLVPATWAIFASEYTGRTGWITRRNVWLLTIEPVLVQIFAWTNEYHHLFWSETSVYESGGYVLLDTAFGLLFWIHAAYSYVLILAGTLFLLQSLVRAPELYRGQMTYILLGVSAPWVANAVYITGLSPLRGVDLTPMAFAIMGLAMGWSLYRFRLFDVVPVARDLVIESLSDVVFVLDQQNRIVDINPAGLQLMGVPDMYGKGVIGQRPSEVVPAYETIFAQFREVEEARTEVVLGAPDARRYFDLRLSPIRDRRGDLTGRLVVLHEMTEQRQAAEQIRQQNEALRKANEEMKAARAQAEEASRLKSEFLATISHELRTPLNSVIGYADLLLTGLAGQLNEKQMDYVQRSLSNGERLLALINELLDISKIESGRFDLHLQPFKVPELLSGAKTRMQNLADKKGLTFTVTRDPALPEQLEGDVKRLDQIIVNLVGNAIKYTETGSVDLQLKRANDSQWAIAVKDTGIGIPPHALEFIFDEFRQVDGSTQREHQGSGLGLTIVRRLTQLMSGTIHIDSEVGKGSTFTITLPLVVPSETRVAEAIG